MSVVRSSAKRYIKDFVFVIACVLVALGSAFVYANFIVDREALREQCLVSDIGMTTPERCR